MIDRRVQKTLLALHQALIALILEKGYDAITVKDIIDRANVGRSTFYAHYLGKEQLLQRGLDDLGKDLLLQQRAARAQHERAAKRFAFSLPFFSHAHSYKQVYRAMVGKHAGAVVTKRLQLVLAGLVREDLASRGMATAPKNLPTDALIQFIVGSIMSILTWWVDERDDFTAEQVDAMFRQLALSAIFPSEAV